MPHQWSSRIADFPSIPLMSEVIGQVKSTPFLLRYSDVPKLVYRIRGEFDRNVVLAIGGESPDSSIGLFRCPPC